MPSISSFRTLTILSACCLFLVCSISLFRLHPFSSGSGNPIRIDILETAGAHDEVLAGLVHAFGSHPDARLSVFQANPRFAIKEVMARFRLPRRVPIARHPNFWGGPSAPDILVSTTCALDIGGLGERWAQLAKIGKTHLFCVVHHGDWWDKRPIEQALTPWIKKGKFSFVALSPHVATFLRDKGLVGWMDDTTKRLQKGIKVFPPVFPVELPPLPGVNASAKTGSKAKAGQEELAFALQGNYDSYRRNFGSVFDDIANLTSISLTPPPTPAKSESKKPDDAKEDAKKGSKKDSKKDAKKEGAKKDAKKEDAKKDSKKKTSPRHQPRTPDNAVIVDSHGRPSMDSLPQRFRWDDDNNEEESGDPTSTSTSKSSKKTNITLHLLGYGNSPNIPPPLADHVMLNPGLSYPDFYSLLSSSMAIIPAFANNQYLDRKASSSVPAALIAGTPLIASRELLDAYSYLDEDSVFMMGGKEEVGGSSGIGPGEKGKGGGKKETRVEVMQRIVDMSEDERTEAKRRVRLRCAALVWQNKEMVSGDGGWIDEVTGRRSRKGSDWRWLRRLQLGKEDG